jgi:hypothetical protein
MLVAGLVILGASFKPVLTLALSAAGKGLGKLLGDDALTLLARAFSSAYPAWAVALLILAVLLVREWIARRVNSAHAKAEEGSPADRLGARKLLESRDSLAARVADIDRQLDERWRAYIAAFPPEPRVALEATQLRRRIELLNDWESTTRLPVSKTQSGRALFSGALDNARH